MVMLGEFARRRKAAQVHLYNKIHQGSLHYAGTEREGNKRELLLLEARRFLVEVEGANGCWQEGDNESEKPTVLSDVADNGSKLEESSHTVGESERSYLLAGPSEGPGLRAFGKKASSMPLSWARIFAWFAYGRFVGDDPPINFGNFVPGKDDAEWFVHLLWIHYDLMDAEILLGRLVLELQV